MVETSHGAGEQNVTVKATGWGSDPYSREWNIYLNLYFAFFALVLNESAALSSATQLVMECLITRFFLPTLLRAGCVKLIYFYEQNIPYNLIDFFGKAISFHYQFLVLWSEQLHQDLQKLYNVLRAINYMSFISSGYQ